MIEVKCPAVLVHNDIGSVFMAGGITGCPNWQAEVVKMCSNRNDLILINPRRDDFDCSKAESSQEQIQWEYKHLVLADQINFWFPKEGLCSITLFELGWALGSNLNIRVGVESGYCRELDVIEQTKLRSNIKIARSLNELYEA